MSQAHDEAIGDYVGWAARNYAIHQFLGPRMGLAYPRRELDDPCIEAIPEVHPLAALVLSPLALGIYLKIAHWYLTPGVINDARVRELLQTADRHSLYPKRPPELAELETVGCLLSDLYGTVHWRDYDRPEDVPHRRSIEKHGWPDRLILPPNPFPEYTGMSWAGERGIETAESYPPPGTNVVYFLRDEDDRLLYVGSTEALWGRFNGHRDKPWTRYEAFECADRPAAYWREAMEIMERDPVLNVEKSVGGRRDAILRGRRRATWALAR